MAASLCSVLAVILLCLAYAHAGAVPDVDQGGASGNVTDIDKTSFPAGEKKYILRNIKVNWFRALQMCLAEGKRLATIKSAEENNDLKKYLKNLGGPVPTDLWISATDLGEEGKFIWMTTAEPVSFTNWANLDHFGQQPDNHRGVEDCAHLWIHKPEQMHSLAWNDADCNSEYAYICEHHHEPATTTVSCKEHGE